MKIFVCNTWIMKIGKCPFETWIMKYSLAIHELWKYLFAKHELWKDENVGLQYMNYENIFSNTWIMKILFAIHEIWKHENVRLEQIMKYVNTVHKKHMNYENTHFYLTDYENVKIFVCNTWIMKIFVCNTWLMKTWKCPFETKYEICKYCT